MTRIMKTSNTMIKQATISRSIFAWFNTDAKNDGQNVSGERNSKLHPYFITGFTDAEGSFLIRFNGKSFIFEYQLVAHERDTALLERIEQNFGCGTISNISNYCRSFKVSDFSSIRKIIIPFFNKYKLRGTKYLDYQD